MNGAGGRLASPPTGGLEMCWTPAEQAGGTTAYVLQHLLSRAMWDADAVRDDNRGFVVERLRHEDGRTHTFAFGRQLDVRMIRSADFEGGQELTERAVAAYIAKYATKGADSPTGTLDRPIQFLAELAGARITDHARRMICTAWDLGTRPELADLRLRAWAHMLGFRGHFSTKSRRYSTTLGTLRDARADWRRAQVVPAVPQDNKTTLVLAHRVFAGTGLSSGEQWLAEPDAFWPGRMW